jgi:hypothetical protein
MMMKNQRVLFSSRSRLETRRFGPVGALERKGSRTLPGSGLDLIGSGDVRARPACLEDPPAPVDFRFDFAIAVRPSATQEEDPDTSDELARRI